MQIIARALSDNRQIYRGASFSADHAHGFRQRLASSGHSIHFIDDIVGPQVHIRRRCALDDTADLRQIRIGIHADIGSDTIIDSLGLFCQFVQFLCGVILGIRIIQSLHQSAVHTVLQLFIGDLA